MKTPPSLRERIFHSIKAHKFTSIREFARKQGCHHSLVEYHLSRLEKAGLIGQYPSVYYAVPGAHFTK